MSDFISILSGFCGITIGSAGTYFLLRSQLVKASKFEELSTQLAVLEKEKEMMLTAHRDNLKKTEDTFRKLADIALKENNQSFFDLAEGRFELLQQKAQNTLDQKAQGISNILNPIKESLLNFDKKIGELEKVREGAYAGLSEKVKSLFDAQNKWATEATNLSKALRDPNVRGKWGEMQLRRVVELTGMINHVDFEEQFSVSNEEKRQQPDMIIHLPNGRNVIVDAKTPSFQSYLNALETDNIDQQNKFLREQAEQIRVHLKKLGTREYFKQFESSPDFVILFLPMESIFSATLKIDPTLIDDSIKNNIILATPFTLIALLRTIEYGWRQEDITKEVKKIRDMGIELYSRISSMTNHFSDMRQSLEKTVECYNKFLSSMESRVLPKLREFKQLQGNESKEIQSIPPIETSIKPVNSIELQTTLQE